MAGDMGAQLQGVFDSVPDGIIWATKHGKILRMNKAVTKLFGFTEKDLVGKEYKALSFLTPKNLAVVAKALVENHVGIRPMRFEIDVKTKNGLKPVEVSISPWFVDGKHKGGVGVLRDLTERKKAEQALRESEEKFRRLFEGSKDGIFIADARTHKLLDCNKAAEKLIGMPKKRLLGMAADQLHPKEDVKRTMDAFKKQAQGSVKAIETLVVTKSGGKVPVNITAYPVTLNGRDCLVGSFRDTTERKKSDDALRESEEKYRSLTLNSPDMTMLTAPDGTITYISPQSKKILGYAPKELEGQVLPPIFHEDDVKRVQQALIGAMNGKAVVDMEYRIIGKKGGVHWVMHNAVPIKENGRVAFIQSNVRDITARMKAEKALEEAYGKLKSLDDLKTDFVQTVSHELRTPITSMKLAAELLGSDLSPEEEVEVKQMVLRNTERIDGVVKTILSFSVMEAGKVKYKHQEVDMNSVVTRAVEGMRKRAEGSGLSVLLELGKVPPVKGDKLWLGIVMDNLLDNAIKFTKEGSITVTVKKKGKRVAVSVRDTGIGVKKSSLGKAFHKFVKMHPHVEGTGVGLWTCKRVVEAHGGEIRIGSGGLGKGATIKFWLPVK